MIKTETRRTVICDLCGTNGGIIGDCKPAHWIFVPTDNKNIPLCQYHLCHICRDEIYRYYEDTYNRN